MAISLSLTSKSAVSLSNESKPSSDLIWDDADWTWNEATGTWDLPGYVLSRESKSNISLSLENK